MTWFTGSYRGTCMTGLIGEFSKEMRVTCLTQNGNGVTGMPHLTVPPPLILAV
jgi:hypothetical protein